MIYNCIKEIESKSDDIFLDELRSICRDQLINYPQLPKASIHTIKSIAKKIMLKNITNRDRYFWPNGLLATALEYSYKKTKDIRDFESLVSYYNKWIDKGLKIYNLDNVINGFSLIYLFEKTNKLKYKKALDLITEYVLNHPKDKHNSLPYRLKSSASNSVGDIYIDSLGMICPFLCRYGKLTNDHKLFDLAITQIKNFMSYGFDHDKGLPYHAYNAENQMKLGIIGWGRGVGWLLIGIIDSIEYIESNHKEYDYLCDQFKKTIKIITKYQHENGYYSWQLEAKEGPIDTSATSMISYAIAKGVSIGLLEKSYNNIINNAMNALTRSTKKGYVVDCSAECHGLSMYPQIYGWFPWSQGPTTSLFSIVESD